MAVVPQRPGEMTVADVRAQANLVRQVLQEVMQEGHHYGSIPGAKGTVLFKAGAEKLAVTFRLAPSYEVETKDLPNGHREFIVTCRMTHITSGTELGSGVGSASTMETKYRYRWQGEGKNRVRRENPDIADVYNTVLKMAKKRAQVDATLTVTGASDIFAPEPEEGEDPVPSEHETLVFECGELHKRLGGDATKVAGIVAEAGVQPGKRLSERTVEELKKIKSALAAAVACILFLLAPAAFAQVVQLQNHGAFPYDGWIRANVDTEPTMAAGLVDGVSWVQGRQTGADTWAVDLHVELPAGKAVRLDLSRSTSWRPPAMHLPSDLLTFFGGPVTIGGVPLQLTGIRQDGAALSVHLRNRLQRTLVGDVWLDWYPGQGWCAGEAMVTSSNPTVPDMVETVGDLQLKFGDAVCFLAGAGFAPLLRAGDTIADGQARAVPVLFVWPRHLTRGSDWSSVGALADSKIGALGIAHSWPVGEPHVPASFDVLKWAVGIYSESARRLHTWDPALLGPAPQSGQTGAQEDQGFVRAEPTLLPGAEIPVYWSALKLAARPCHHREVDGSPLDGDRHVEPRLILWDSRPHWHTQVSPERWGKPRGLDRSESHGWSGADVEHWLFSTLALAKRYTGSHACDALLEAQARIYPLQHTVTPGWSTSQAYASRAAGWECLAVVHLARALDDRSRAKRVLLHWAQRMESITMPTFETLGDFWDVRRDDPRLGSGDWWMPWQQSVGAFFMDLAGQLHGDVLADDGVRLRKLALRGASVVVRDAWVQVGTRWQPKPIMPVGGGGVPDPSFTYFGMPLSVATVLRHEPQHAKARAIWSQLEAEARDVGQAKWLAPGVR